MVADYETRIAQYHRPDAEGVSASFLTYYDSSGLTFKYGTTQFVCDVFGFEPAPGASEFAESQNVSDELFSKVNADLFFVTHGSFDGSLDALFDNPLYTALDAPSNDNVIVIERKSKAEEQKSGNLAWALSTGGPLAKLWAAEQLSVLLDQHTA